MNMENEQQNAVRIQDELWNARMDTLESNWHATMAETQAEYQHDRKKWVKAAETCDRKSRIH